MRRHALLVGLIVLITTARFATLLTFQTHVHSDEAIIGLMAKHILEGRHFPFYMYGQPYNAGAGWEAYLAAVAFAFFGVSVISLKSCIVVLSLVCLFLFYRMCVALSGERLFLVFPFDSSADASALVDRIDPESAVAVISFIRHCFGFQRLESGTGHHV